LASLFSDWSHEMATAVMPAFLATMGVAAFWVGLIEEFPTGCPALPRWRRAITRTKLQRRKPVAVIGYLVTAVGTASFGLATAAWHVYWRGRLRGWARREDAGAESSAGRFGDEGNLRAARSASSE